MTRDQTSTDDPLKNNGPEQISLLANQINSLPVEAGQPAVDTEDTDRDLHATNLTEVDFTQSSLSALFPPDVLAAPVKGGGQLVREISLPERFANLECYAQGARNIMLRALDTETDTQVLIRFPRPDLSIGGLHIVFAFERYEQEFRTLRHVEGPGVPSAVMVCESEYGPNELICPCLVLDYVAGNNLRDLIGMGFLDLNSTFGFNRTNTEKFLAIGTGICDVVERAHQLGIIHRDLKPANVVVSEHGGTTVVDWELAWLSAGDEAYNFGDQGGTMAYLPPEQMLPYPPQPSPATDVYSLGALIYTMITEKAPFENMKTGQIYRTVLAGNEPTPVSELNPDVPASIEAVIERSMSRRPEERYQSAGELKQALITAVNTDAYRI